MYEVIYGVSKQRHTVLYLGKLDDEVLGTRNNATQLLAILYGKLHNRVSSLVELQKVSRKISCRYACPWGFCGESRAQGNDDDGILSSEKKKRRADRLGRRGAGEGGEVPPCAVDHGRFQTAVSPGLFARSSLLPPSPPPRSPSVNYGYVRETVICTKGAS